MKKRTQPRYTNNRPYAPRTGEHCPVSGWWQPAYREAEAKFVTEGSIMPSDEGNATTWTLVGARDHGEDKPAWPRNHMLDAL